MPQMSKSHFGSLCANFMRYDTHDRICTYFCPKEYSYQVWKKKSSYRADKWHGRTDRRMWRQYPSGLFCFQCSGLRPRLQFMRSASDIAARRGFFPLPAKVDFMLVPKVEKWPIFADFERRKNFFKQIRWFFGRKKSPFLNKMRL